MKQKTKKQHTSPYTPDPLFTAVTKSLPATLGFAALAVAMGILFILLLGDTTPVPREEAIAYEGEFARYEVDTMTSTYALPTAPASTYTPTPRPTTFRRP